MRNFLVLFLSAGMYLSAGTQPVPDAALFGMGMQMIDAAASAEQYVSAAAFFRNLADQHEDLWLARYYAALSFTLASQEDDTEKAKDSLIDQAQLEVEKAMAIAPEEPEILILQAFVYQSRIQVNPVARGLSYSMRANALLQKAMEGNPGNPRAQLLLAYNTYYTPVMVGGGASHALPLFIKARDLFEVFRPDSDFSPRWGRQEAVEMIESCRSEINP